MPPTHQPGHPERPAGRETAAWPAGPENHRSEVKKPHGGPETGPTADSSRELEAIQASIERLAHSSEHVRERSERLVSERSIQSQRPLYVNQELKNLAYYRTLRRTRKQLSFADRQLSRLIHYRAVDRLSELGGKTVARPSALLGSGLAGLVGGGGYYWLAKNYGYEYRFSLFLILLAGGLAAGLGVELLGKLLRRRGA